MVAQTVVGGSRLQVLRFELARAERTTGCPAFEEVARLMPSGPYNRERTYLHLVPCIPSPPGECRFQGPAVAMLDTTLGKACSWKDPLFHFTLSLAAT